MDPRTGLTSKRGTHNRMAPGCKGNPSNMLPKFETEQTQCFVVFVMSRTMRCFLRKLCLNFIVQKRASKRAPEWLPLSVTERLSDPRYNGQSLTDTGIWRESWIPSDTPLQHSVTVPCCRVIPCQITQNFWSWKPDHLKIFQKITICTGTCL